MRDLENVRDEAVKVSEFVGVRVSIRHCRDRVVITPLRDLRGRVCDTVIFMGMLSPGRQAGFRSSMVAIECGVDDVVGEGGIEGMAIEGFNSDGD